MSTEQVILVNEHDEPIGTMEKMQAHREARLHRAFSVFVFNQEGELLLHQRAHEKYHSGGLWTNTCCSHPRAGESVEEAAHRRLVEEMGFDCPLQPAFSFTYKAVLDNELTEYEFDHVLIGQYDQAPEVNPSEVADWKYVSMDRVRADLSLHPELFTEWFKIAFSEVEKHYQQLKKAS